jgi:hypothetical protein
VEKIQEENHVMNSRLELLEDALHRRKAQSDNVQLELAAKNVQIDLFEELKSQAITLQDELQSVKAELLSVLASEHSLKEWKVAHESCPSGISVVVCCSDDIGGVWCLVRLVYIGTVDVV